MAGPAIGLVPVANDPYRKSRLLTNGRVWCRKKSRVAKTDIALNRSAVEERAATTSTAMWIIFLGDDLPHSRVGLFLFGYRIDHIGLEELGPAIPKSFEVCGPHARCIFFIHLFDCPAVS